MSRFEVDFTAKDYTALLTLADEYAKELLPEWKSRDDNDINWVTLKVAAKLAEVALIYVDVAYNEGQPNTARFRGSLLKHAYKFRYPVKRAIGATTVLKITKNDLTSSLSISKGESFSTASGVVYSAVKDYFLPVGVDSIDIEVRYGSLKNTLLAISDGRPYQSFELDSSIQGRLIEVFVDGVKWTEIESLIMSKTDNEYTLNVLENENIELLFGDGVCGNIPISGKNITYSYWEMPSGASARNYGNIPKGNIINSNLPVTVEHLVDATGGSPKEMDDEIRRNISQWISTAARIAGPKDVAYLAERVPGVKKAQVFVDVYDYKVVIITADGLATPTLKSEVELYLRKRLNPQIGLSIESPIPAEIIVKAVIKIDAEYNRQVVSEAFRTKLEETIEATPVGGSVLLMDVYTTKVAGVKSIFISKLYQKDKSENLTDVQLLPNEYAQLSDLSEIIFEGGL